MVWNCRLTLLWIFFITRTGFIWLQRIWEEEGICNSRLLFSLYSFLWTSHLKQWLAGCVFFWLQSMINEFQMAHNTVIIQRFLLKFIHDIILKIMLDMLCGPEHLYYYSVYPFIIKSQWFFFSLQFHILLTPVEL